MDSSPGLCGDGDSALSGDIPSGDVLSGDSGLFLTASTTTSLSESEDGTDNREWNVTDECLQILDDCSVRSTDDEFNTLKKAPFKLDVAPPIDPPPEFQDKPNPILMEKLEKLACKLISEVITEALNIACKATWSIQCSQECHPHQIDSELCRISHLNHVTHLCWTPEPPSRPITQSTSDIPDLYTVPLDSDVYAVPIDVVQQIARPRARLKPQQRRRPRRPSGSSNQPPGGSYGKRTVLPSDKDDAGSMREKRHSVPIGGDTTNGNRRNKEPIHMTLAEVREYLTRLYGSDEENGEVATQHHDTAQNKDTCLLLNFKHRRSKEEGKSHRSLSTCLKHTFCNWFKPRRHRNIRNTEQQREEERKEELRKEEKNREEDNSVVLPLVAQRALPPLPSPSEECPLDNVLDNLPTEEEFIESTMDFAASIEKVKDYGWYWGPLSGESAERVLSSEPDGSFIVRDSSDHHYIFSLTFKLNGFVRHVRIEHDQGSFSFGSCTKFKSHTIVEFIENAVEHSRSGRYLFFLHRRPVLGPMRVQLLHPVSRFKQVQSLQHMCRFVIVKHVRRDLIESLPLPKRLICYLNAPHYYSEQLEDNLSTNKITTELATNLTPHHPQPSAFVLAVDTDMSAGGLALLGVTTEDSLS